MIYQSNLALPEIQKHFKNVHCRPMPHSMGHDVLSDFADRPADDPVFGLYKNCGFWTHSEAAILYAVAQQLGGYWLDIGAHTGWTTAIMAEAGCSVDAIDPMFRVPEFLERFHENTKFCVSPIATSFETSNEWFRTLPIKIRYDGVSIDGDHSEGKPLEDAINAVKHLEDTGAILLHDFWGWPVQEAVIYLLDHGFKGRVYHTPHGVALCWRGDLEPPEYVEDRHIPWQAHRAQANRFPWHRTI